MHTVLQTEGYAGGTDGQQLASVPNLLYNNPYSGGNEDTDGAAPAQRE